MENRDSASDNRINLSYDKNSFDKVEYYIKEVLGGLSRVDLHLKIFLVEDLKKKNP